jgi:hypothetical protein
MSGAADSQWDGIERRRAKRGRRSSERRLKRERRCDVRDGQPRQRRSFSGWVRALFRARLGVDRRKNPDQRINPDRRGQSLKALLSREELRDLLR